MRKLVPVILIMIGLAAGLGAGMFLRPASIATAAQEAGEHSAAGIGEESKTAAQAADFVKMPNQFIVPIVEKGRITSLVIVTLSLEVAPGGTEQVFAQEPKLRDGMLQLLFDHANIGGFRGSFTESDNLVILRRGLTEVAQTILGKIVRNVLITDIIRQDS